jgi:hypothetical protein
MGICSICGKKVRGDYEKCFTCAKKAEVNSNSSDDVAIGCCELCKSKKYKSVSFANNRFLETHRKHGGQDAIDICFDCFYRESFKYFTKTKKNTHKFLDNLDYIEKRALYNLQKSLFYDDDAGAEKQLKIYEMCVLFRTPQQAFTDFKDWDKDAQEVYNSIAKELDAVVI